MFTGIEAGIAGALAHHRFKSDGRAEFQRKQQLDFRTLEQTPFFHDRSVKA